MDVRDIGAMGTGATMAIGGTAATGITMATGTIGGTMATASMDMARSEAASTVVAAISMAVAADTVAATGNFQSEPRKSNGRQHPLPAVVFSVTVRTLKRPRIVRKEATK
jgi:hypothetical protein